MWSLAHAYVERRIRPLNLFLLEADEEAKSRRRAITDRR